MVKARRTRSPHPGVVLVRPDVAGRHPHWRARFDDPDSGLRVKVTLDPVAITTAEARRDWAIKKSKALARRRVELETGAVRATGTALNDAVDRYFSAHPQLAKNTRTAYEAAAKKFKAWAARIRLESADDLTRARLMSFREELAKAPKRVAVAGSKRGQRRADPEAGRSPHSLNRDLRSAGTILGYLCDLDLFPRLTRDDIRRALKRQVAPVERINFLKPHQLQKLLEAALRHDAKVFSATREEHAGKRTPGTTPKYDAIAPFVACTLLTGMRFSACLSLRWEDVDLDALDHEGRVAGEIHPRGGSYTKRAGAIGLEVSPALRTMLAAMRLKSGGKGAVFTLTEDAVKAAGKRLVREFGAPANFNWQALRKTCGTFLTNAPGIFGAASAYRSAKQLGHSVQVAERHYVDLVRGIAREARDLETAMQINEQMARITRAVGQRETARAPKIG